MASLHRSLSVCFAVFFSSCFYDSAILVLGVSDFSSIFQILEVVLRVFWICFRLVTVSDR